MTLIPYADHLSLPARHPHSNQSRLPASVGTSDSNGCAAGSIPHEGSWYPSELNVPPTPPNLTPRGIEDPPTHTHTHQGHHTTPGGGGPEGFCFALFRGTPVRAHTFLAAMPHFYQYFKRIPVCIVLSSLGAACTVLTFSQGSSFQKQLIRETCGTVQFDSNSTDKQTAEQRDRPPQLPQHRQKTKPGDREENTASQTTPAPRPEPQDTHQDVADQECH